MRIFSTRVGLIRVYEDVHISIGRVVWGLEWTVSCLQGCGQELSSDQTLRLLSQIGAKSHLPHHEQTKVSWNVTKVLLPLLLHSWEKYLEMFIYDPAKTDTSPVQLWVFVVVFPNKLSLMLRWHQRLSVTIRCYRVVCDYQLRHEMAKTLLNIPWDWGILPSSGVHKFSWEVILGFAWQGKQIVESILLTCVYIYRYTYIHI